jgi:hypothetical protein
MQSADRAGRTGRRHLLSRRIPDPLQAHGAWVYLAVSVLAGALTGVREGMLSALLAGLGFAGVVLGAGALGMRDPGRRAARLLVGGFLAVAAPLGAIALGADARFLVYGLVAIAPAAAAGYLGERAGYRSAPALAFAVTALVVAAPTAACAGGATTLRSWLLLVLLAPFFAWRVWRTLKLIHDRRGWTRPQLRARGWREAAYAVAWTAGAVLVIHVVG